MHPVPLGQAGAGGQSHCLPTGPASSLVRCQERLRAVVLSSDAKHPSRLPVSSSPSPPLALRPAPWSPFACRASTDLLFQAVNPQIHLLRFTPRCTFFWESDAYVLRVLDRVCDCKEKRRRNTQQCRSHVLPSLVLQRA